MRLFRKYVKRFIQVTDTITKEMSPREFIDFASANAHLIKESRFVPCKRGSGKLGKFIVVIEDGNLHITTTPRR
jgi:hypothetical protein